MVRGARGWEKGDGGRELVGWEEGISGRGGMKRREGVSGREGGKVSVGGVGREGMRRGEREGVSGRDGKGAAPATRVPSRLLLSAVRRRVHDAEKCNTVLPTPITMH